jgi:hypothetical protein
VAVQVLSILLNPIYGETYSFPWKRGPHDNLKEYLETVPIFDSVRNAAFQTLLDFDFIAKLATVFHSEEESSNVVTKVATLRIITQFMRLNKKELNDLMCENLIEHTGGMQLLSLAALNSKDGVV